MTKTKAQLRDEFVDAMAVRESQPYSLTPDFVREAARAFLAAPEGPTTGAEIAAMESARASIGQGIRFQEFVAALADLLAHQQFDWMNLNVHNKARRAAGLLDEPRPEEENIIESIGCVRTSAEKPARSVEEILEDVTLRVGNYCFPTGFKQPAHAMATMDGWKDSLREALRLYREENAAHEQQIRAYAAGRAHMESLAEISRLKSQLQEAESRIEKARKLCADNLKEAPRGPGWMTWFIHETERILRGKSDGS